MRVRCLMAVATLTNDNPRTQCNNTNKNAKENKTKGKHTHK